MRSDETIDKFLEAKRSGLNYVQASEVAGVSIYVGWQWVRGNFPRRYCRKYANSPMIIDDNYQAKGVALTEKRPHEKALLRRC